MLVDHSFRIDLVPPTFYYLRTGRTNAYARSPTLDRAALASYTRRMGITLRCYVGPARPYQGRAQGRYVEVESCSIAVLTYAQSLLFLGRRVFKKGIIGVGRSGVGGCLHLSSKQPRRAGATARGHVFQPQIFIRNKV